MGLDLWFREDVARILASIQQTMTASLGAVPTQNPEVADAYQEGFADALQAVAVAFGIAAPSRPVETLRVIDAAGVAHHADAAHRADVAHRADAAHRWDLAYQRDIPLQEEL
jgi:hypothetical protein